MTSPLTGGDMQPTNMTRTFKAELILMMAIAASKAAAGPSDRNSMQAARQLFET
jgi:hypothetical protein